MNTASTDNFIYTETPSRKAGQSNVLSLSLAPMPHLRVAFVGLGARGITAVKRWCNIDGVQIAALCDVSRQATEDAAQLVEQTGMPRPEMFWGENAYRQLCMQPDIHLIYICTDWLSHVPIALLAMQNRKCAAVEVPAATTLADIWKLVDTAEQTQMHCMMLENAVYDRFEMAVQAMAADNLFGEIVHAEGGYAHLMDNRWTPWRMEYNKLTKGDVYPTHGMGPVCRILDMHRSDRMHLLTAMDTKAFLGAETFQKITKQTCDNFANGDQTSVMIRTLKGKTISIQHNVMTPRPYSRMFQIVGTKGYAAKYPVEEIALNRASAEKIGVHTDESYIVLNETETRELLNRYPSPFSGETLALAEQLDTRGGMSYLMDLRLAQCLQQGLPLDMDVYDMAEWCCISELSKLSIEHHSMPVSVPDFTRGAAL